MTASLPSSFRSSIVGGIGTLIRQWIRSPDYVPGVSGWSINKDGSVEFNLGTFRGTLILDDALIQLLVYSGTPAAGNLILAISSAAGTDSFGNAYDIGLTIYGHGAAGAITFREPADGNISGQINSGVNGALVVRGGYPGGDDGHIEMRANNVASGLYQGFWLYPEGVQFGTAGHIGKVSSCAWSWAQSIPSGAVTQLVGPLGFIQADSDYGGGEWAGYPAPTGTFNPPAAGWYDLSLFVVNTLAAANFIRAVIRVNGVNVVAANGANGGDVTASAPIYLNPADVVTFFVRQNTAGAVNMSGTLSACRRLA